MTAMNTNQVSFAKVSYIDFFRLQCASDGGVGQAIVNYSNASIASDAGLLHTTSLSTTTELTQGTAGCTSPSGSGNVYLMNPGNAAMQSFIHGTEIPAAYPAQFNSTWTIFEDDFSYAAPGYNTNSGTGSFEYGLTGGGVSDNNWSAAGGLFANGICPTGSGTGCYQILYNRLGGGGNYPANDSSTPDFNGVHNHQLNVDGACGALTTGKLTAFIGERVLYGSSVFTYNNLPTFFNTESDLFSHTTGPCSNTKIIELEQTTGADSVQIRSVQTVMAALIPAPSGDESKWVYWRYPFDNSSINEQTVWGEEAYWPTGAEQIPAKWNYAGTSAGTGCGAGASSDSGGVNAITVFCSGTTAVYAQQYAHVYINGVDHGKGMFVWNNTASAVAYSALTLGGDPLTSYHFHYGIGAGTGELNSITFGGTTYPLCNSLPSICNGSLPAAGAAFNSTDTIPSEGAQIVLSS
jgi:hypothetical protein